ncbi:MAG: thioredoxin, partial [Halobacteria archaeon]|nr:thioredoxin [Halobacteria archaeon]
MHASRNMTFSRPIITQLILLLSLVYCGPALASIDTEDVFDDQPLSDDLIMPDWFKVSFLDLQEDLNEAVENSKQGLIVYFGQKRCAYCKAHLENNWGQKDILAYTQKHFEVIHINIRGQ